MGYEDFSGRLIFPADKIKDENEIEKNKNENEVEKKEIKNKKNISRGPTMILEFRKKLRNLTETVIAKNEERSYVRPTEIISTDNSVKIDCESVLLSVNENDKEEILLTSDDKITTSSTASFPIPTTSSTTIFDFDTDFNISNISKIISEKISGSTAQNTEIENRIFADLDFDDFEIINCEEIKMEMNTNAEKSNEKDGEEGSERGSEGKSNMEDLMKQLFSALHSENEN